MVEVIHRGEVWPEVGKVRPVLIVQADALNEARTPVVVVLPLTTVMTDNLAHLRVTVPARDRLLRPSQVVVDQPRTLDRTRIGEGPLTTLSAAEMRRVDRGLLAVLGLL